jgi:hypothetical protein
MIADQRRRQHRAPAELAEEEILAALRGELADIAPARRWLEFDSFDVSVSSDDHNARDLPSNEETLNAST